MERGGDGVQRGGVERAVGDRHPYLEGLAHAQANLDSLTLRPAATPQRGAGRDAMLAPHALAAERARVVLTVAAV